MRKDHELENLLMSVAALSYTDRLQHGRNNEQKGTDALQTILVAFMQRFYGTFMVTGINLWLPPFLLQMKLQNLFT